MLYKVVLNLQSVERTLVTIQMKATEQSSFMECLRLCVFRPVTWYGINYAGTQITQWDFQRNSCQYSPTFLCFESPTALFASQHDLFLSLWPDHAKSLFIFILLNLYLGVNGSKTKTSM